MNKTGIFYRLFKEEVFLSFLLGSVPMIISVMTNPKSVPTTYIQNLSPDDSVFWYFTSLFIFHIIMSFLLKKWKKPRIEYRARMRLFLRLTEQLGTAIHGVFRAIMGALPIALCVLLLDVGFATGWGLASGFTIALAVGMVVPCVLMAYLSCAVEEKNTSYNSSSVEFTNK